MKKFIEKIKNKENLSFDESKAAFGLLMEGKADIDKEELSKDLFSEEFLIKRPLLQALEPQAGGAPILLIDELDRTDAPFEAFLLEVLSDSKLQSLRRA